MFSAGELWTAIVKPCRSYLRVREVAERLGVSERTVRRWISTGKLPSIRIGGTRLVPRNSLVDFSLPTVDLQDDCENP